MQDADRDEFERRAEREGYRLMRRAGSARYESELTQAFFEGWHSHQESARIAETCTKMVILR